MRMAKSPSELATRSSHPAGVPGLAVETWGAAAPTLPRTLSPETSPETVTDVCIVGGGPAGLACAIAATLRGLRVQVIDALQPPIDKACGESLMPDTLSALVRLGIQLEDPTRPALGHPLHGIRFLNADPA